MTTISSIPQLLESSQNGSLKFTDVLNFIETNYQFTPTAFTNGEQHNAETENQGSAKVFAFAKLNDLTKEQTLALFAEHYQSVLATPDGNDHSNIRNFMQFGWDGIKMEVNPLRLP